MTSHDLERSSRGPNTRLEFNIAKTMLFSNNS